MPAGVSGFRLTISVVTVVVCVGRQGDGQRVVAGHWFCCIK